MCSARALTQRCTTFFAGLTQRTLCALHGKASPVRFIFNSRQDHVLLAIRVS